MIQAKSEILELRMKMLVFILNIGMEEVRGELKQNLAFTSAN